ncbi:M56 family metallopeptidase [Chitinophaga pinensis]|uniref:TonB family protein n=1 Tax=Chitinophaga pinensis (strain ATCC 43595 / DSM 2588 / LMG 13176 / NBRC 15968 / NCIMB 11800 / UQM 2034) TaxID=485918 RepID=A0A979GB05_CHIPD|nr:M56 family metallopeptidase [Chitinophaga pinensis]ACU63925.1 TonB family protein [Chitinophaga pinensis DSM 2588]
MNAFLPYVIKMLLCSGILYGYYALVLKNNSFHRWNRAFILLAVIASLLIPTLQFSMNTTPITSQQLNMIVVCGYVADNMQKAGLDLTSWIPAGIYLFITLLLLANIASNWILVKRLIRKGEKTTFNGYQLIHHPQVKSTFSFFGSIFWAEEATKDSPEGRQILKHELEHVRGGHTGEKLFMQLVCAVCWFNPFFYLLRKELSMVHEFLADKAATEDSEAEDYARTLLQVTLQTRLPLMINTFGQAPVKRRILMLFTQRSNYSLMKRIIVIPLVLGLGFVIGCQRDLDLNAKNIVDVTKSIAVSPADHEVYSFVSDPPTYPGGMDALSKYLGSSIRYPKKAQDHGTTGTIFVSFVIDSEGNVSNAKTVGNVHGDGLEEESIRVVSSMPKWNPGKQDGQAVSVAFTLPIKFVLMD